jgi:hypothetical protein
MVRQTLEAGPLALSCPVIAATCSCPFGYGVKVYFDNIWKRDGGLAFLLQCAQLVGHTIDTELSCCDEPAQSYGPNRDSNMPALDFRFQPTSHETSNVLFQLYDQHTTFIC